MFTHTYQIIQQRAVAHPSAIALGGQQGLGWRALTSRQLLSLVDGLAPELAGHGVGVGDRVVLWAPNAWRTPVYLFALWKLGAIIVPFDKEMNPEAAAEIIASVEPRLIIAGYGERPVWAREREVVEWWEPNAEGAAGTTPNWTPSAEELAAIFFTSGTTGKPKGCMITHANLCFQVDILERIPMDTSCRLASILPLSHLFEMTCGLLYPLSRGAAIHYIPSRRGPDIVRVLREQRVTHMIAVPQLLTLMGNTMDTQLRAKLPAPAYQALTAAAERLPLPARHRLFFFLHRRIGGQLRVLASGGAPLAPEVQRLWERFGVRVLQGYGTSECSPTISSASNDGSTPVGSVGKPLRGVEVSLSPEGELLVRGPNVMRGYWKDPARTAEVMRDGWYATGDLGTIDASGNIWLQGRAKELIVLPSGMKVWPQDVEDVLRAYPGVKDAAVMAVSGAGGGATLHAYLIPASAQARDTDLGALVNTSNARLAQHQRLATASWWPEEDFPRTSTLKLRRSLLPTPEQASAIRVTSVLAADDPVSQAIAGAARLPSVMPRQTLAALGLDSLGLVELALALEEKTGVSVTDEDLSLEMTVEGVRVLMAARATGDEAAARATGAAEASVDQPLWPYTWGRNFRFLGGWTETLMRAAATRVIVRGGEHLADLPARVIFAGTHHGFADMPLIRHSLRRTPARLLADRLVIAAQAGGFASAGLYAKYAMLAFGLYPLRQRGDREASLRRLAEIANAGNAVLIFPQGIHARPERERADDPATRFRPGVAHLAAALEAVVVPFGLAGTERVMPAHLDDYKGLVIAGIPISIRRGPLAIAYGAPLTLQPDEAPAGFAARLQAASYALTRQAEAALAETLTAPSQPRLS